MSQNLIPLNGGREKVILTPFVPAGFELSKQFTEVYKLEPIPTEWRSSGRPIYGRLPGVSERYRTSFPLDGDTAYTYIPVGEGITGPTSMAVGTSGNNRYLYIQGGSICWKYGTIAAAPVVIDIQLVGMGSARYLLAYQLVYDGSPIQAEYEVDDFNLVGYEMDVRSNTDDIKGWRYSTKNAFVNLDQLYWSNYDSYFPSYSQPAELSWQMPLPARLSKITLRCPPNTGFTGSASLYYMTCSSSNEGVFCDDPVWTYAETVNVSKDETSQYFEFEIDSPWTVKGWKVEWTDQKMSISNIYVSGVLTLTRRPAAKSTSYALVAYPVNSIPSTIENSLGEDIPLILCKLAYVDINSEYTVTDLTDAREIVFNSYEPVAEWLTRPWDENLMSVFDQIDNYGKYWLDPIECMRQEYASLAEDDIILDLDRCPQPPTQEL